MRVPLRLGRYTLTRASCKLQNGMLPWRVMYLQRSSFERKRASSSSGLVSFFSMAPKCLEEVLFGENYLLDINLQLYLIAKWALFLKIQIVDLLYVVQRHVSLLSEAEVDIKMRL
ncbi:hypothetical protein FGO68_gene9157 [Halteria grandinella]|uniref:Uncharacterized protein n=1 Tax=Halteria grandinella TaxID=5974 RepID=A0A8J8N9N0_HALGN|nr:hypothetical protein FGO68_gene9157 [Halteria grandinella]